MAWYASLHQPSDQIPMKVTMPKKAAFARLPASRVHSCSHSGQVGPVRPRREYPHRTQCVSTRRLRRSSIR